MVIVDTNVVSELLRPAPEPNVEAWLATVSASEVYLTATSAAELRYGATILPEGRRRNAIIAAIEGILSEDFVGRILPFDADASETYARIAADRRGAGRAISQFDCQIAAVARVNKATLATRNTRDFEGCGIRLFDPWLPRSS